MRKLSIVFAVAVCLIAVPVISALAQSLVPPTNGFFGIKDGKLVQLMRPEVAIKEHDGKNVKGFPKNTHFKRFDNNARFVMRDDFVNPHDGHVMKLVYEGRKIVDGQEFKTDRWELDMYVRDGQPINVMVAKVPGQDNVSQVYFKDPLKPGKYVIYFGDSMSDVLDDKYKNNLFVFEIK